MDLTEALGWAGTRKNAVLVTLRKDGRAQSSDVAYALDDGTFLTSPERFDVFVEAEVAAGYGAGDAVARVEAPYLLVLGPPDDRETTYAAHLSYPAWTFRLTPVGPERCRLVVRFQNDFAPSPLAWLGYKYALAPAHFVMERKMMLGIKRRAEHA